MQANAWLAGGTNWQSVLHGKASAEAGVNAIRCLMTCGFEHRHYRSSSLLPIGLIAGRGDGRTRREIETPRLREPADQAAESGLGLGWAGGERIGLEGIGRLQSEPGQPDRPVDQSGRAIEPLLNRARPRRPPSGRGTRTRAVRNSRVPPVNARRSNERPRC